MIHPCKSIVVLTAVLMILVGTESSTFRGIQRGPRRREPRGRKPWKCWSRTKSIPQSWWIDVPVTPEYAIAGR